MPHSIKFSKVAVFHFYPYICLHSLSWPNYECAVVCDMSLSLWCWMGLVIYGGGDHNCSSGPYYSKHT